tara:strand:+ start:920 stop:1678 length:759 start_codon:yes stop_codon:yes gene_type:complete
MVYKEKIVNWLKEYAESNNMDGFVVGISGGIDSAVTSTLCALTGLKVRVLTMPIHQDPALHSLSELQIKWLEDNFSNVIGDCIDLTNVYDSFEESVCTNELGLANTRARLRMTTLYAVAGDLKLLVAGTGNKVEDFGVGFFTKYGDGGVDISPIADLMKSQVYELAKKLGVPQEIQDVPPTDGLWGDSRNDEDQLGATYDELEWAMKWCEDKAVKGLVRLTPRQKKVLDIYSNLHNQNYHKMIPIPVCKINE